MSIHDEILALLSTKGAMGVNELATATNTPLSTMQKYLTKDQNYFKKNQSRKWVLPENAVESEMSNVSSNMDNIINSQLMSINALFETLMSQFKATVTLMETNKGRTATVADKSPKLHPSIDKVLTNIKTLEEGTKQYKSKIPEEYRDLVMNADLTVIMLRKGHDYWVSTLQPEITGILLNERDTLADETVELLETYQKGA